jgi:hypothetical protein
MDSSTVFGLTIAPGPGSDIFVPSGEWINGRSAWRGLQSRLWMYYCNQTKDDFTWVLAGGDDLRSPDQCDGSVWMNLHTTAAWTPWSQTRIGGIRVDVGLEKCNGLLATHEARLAPVHVSPPDAGASNQPERIGFLEGVSAAQVACTFFWGKQF